MVAKSSYPNEWNDDTALVRAAVDDITPPSFRDHINRRLQESITVPGLLTRLAARAAGPDVQAEEIDHRVVGVQLIYEGLKLTRTLARFPPWNDEQTDAANLEILVAEVLVARGFSLLARTEAVSEAVETVRTFGRDEMNRQIEGVDFRPPDRALEAAVFELGIVAGVTATGAQPPPEVHAFTAKLAESMDEKPASEAAELSDTEVEELNELL